MARRNDDVSNDLHIKMCKKIAQITKVVFHLNSKVSENQKVINESKVKHDENIKCLTKSFNAKTVKYEQQLEAAQQQQKVANYIQCDFEKVRLENQYLLTKLNEHQEANYLYKEQLSRAFEEKGFLQNQLLKQKNDTELLIKELIFDLENKMQILLEKKESQYQEEINTIKSDNEKKLSEIDHKNKLLELDNEKKLMEISFFKVNSNDLNIRVQSLEEIKVSLEFEIAKLTKSYNTKINELNLFYENEINMLKVKYVHDNENFQFKEKSQLQDLESKSFNFQNQVRMLQCELSIKEKEMSDLKIEFAFLQDSLGTKNVLLSQLVNELEEKKQCILALEENVKISKNENIAKLDEARLTFKNLEKERDNAMLHMSEKNDAITDLQTALEHVNNEMNKQLKKFKDLQDTSSILLEENKIYQKNIEDEKSSTLMYSELYKNNLAIKEEEIQNLRSELSRIKDKHTFDVSNLEKKLKEDLVLKEEKHLKTVDKLINEHEQKLVSIKNELSLELKQEKLNIVNLHCAQINEKENTITFLKTSIEKHISHNSSLNSQIAGYKEFIRCCVDTEKRLSEEILELKHKLSAAENQNFYLQKCVTDIKNVEQKQAILWQEEKNNFQSSCENLNNEKLLIEIEWQKKIVNEVLKWKLKLKSLQEKKDQELLKAKQALQLFTEKKEQEIFILKEQITQLNSVITRQQNQLSLTLLEQQKTIELLNKNFEEEKVLFENNSRLTITAMDSGHSKEIEDIKLHLIKDKESAILALNQKYEKKILDIQKENQLYTDALKSNLEYQNKKAVVELTKSFDEEKALLQSSLHLQYEEKIKKQSEEFNDKFIACKKKLIFSEEVRDKELSIYNEKVSDLLKQLEQEKEQVKTLSLKINYMTDETIKIGKEIYLKGQEVLDVRRECNLQMREQLEILTMKHNVYVDEVKAKCAYELNLMANEHSEKILKFQKEVESLKLDLKNASNMFHNRPSRKEDIDLIDELKNCIFEQELEIRKLTKDKEHYRLELINREQNFNKLFNSSPHVGVINPIAKITSKTIFKN
ncbi:protein FAM184A isoform X3 [Hydra vulgaris]|uniref:Protein FAM184A isoform X3 n=1 Tax=Hydra vulgaris TaxID=6087 RepID=A0ABM4BL68_HYDVU